MGREKRERAKRRRGLTRHHRVPESLGGDNGHINISYIPNSEHAGWHNAFDRMGPCEVVARMNALFIPPDFQAEIIKHPPCDSCAWKGRCSLAELKKNSKSRKD